VSPVRYELSFYNPEDDILHSHRRRNPQILHQHRSCIFCNKVSVLGKLTQPKTTLRFGVVVRNKVKLFLLSISALHVFIHKNAYENILSVHSTLPVIMHSGYLAPLLGRRAQNILELL
jgi:hypothetical protein